MLLLMVSYNSLSLINIGDGVNGFGQINLFFSSLYYAYIVFYFISPYPLFIPADDSFEILERIAALEAKMPSSPTECV